MLESKLFKPFVNSLRQHNCDLMQVLGISIMLLLSLPRKIMAFCALLTGQSPEEHDGVDKEKAIKGAAALVGQTLTNSKRLKGVATDRTAKPKRSDAASQQHDDVAEYGDGDDADDGAGDDGADEGGDE